jgi:hypothetical protein
MRKINTVADNRSQSQFSLHVFLIGALQVRVLPGSPLILTNSTFISLTVRVELPPRQS